MSFKVQIVDINLENSTLYNVDYPSDEFFKTVSNSLQYGRRVCVFSKNDHPSWDEGCLEFLVPSLEQVSLPSTHSFNVSKSPNVCDQIREILQEVGYTLRTHSFVRGEEVTGDFSLTAVQASF